MIFDDYLFADYSGALTPASQRKSIRLAHGSRDEDPVIVPGRFTRETLVDEIVSRLGRASAAGRRVCFGQDHQYSIPFALVRELGLEGLDWVSLLGGLSLGTYGGPALGHPSTFCCKFNEWFRANSREPYFYSATKGKYGLPGKNPRAGQTDLYRMTERCRAESGTGAPKPFNRVGDPGTVGGQSLLGMAAIHALLQTCRDMGIRVAAWPFDGLSIDDKAYSGAHVLMEPYPSASRALGTTQSDDSDALASASLVRSADIAGALPRLLDLSDLSAGEAAVVRLEGWIVSHRPRLPRGL